ncbi:MAG: hypothetical protein ACOZNI_29345 [Myxococcota bacterium]
MTDRVAGAVAALLAVAAALQVHALLKPASGFATMPILVPVSLAYEQQMRAARAQPATDGGEGAMRDAERLAAGGAGLEATLRPKIEALRDTRAKLLDARGRRHALNIRLMDVGVAVATELTPAQWDRIHMRRDALRAEADAAVFDRLLGKLR